MPKGTWAPRTRVPKWNFGSVAKVRGRRTAATRMKVVYAGNQAAIDADVNSFSPITQNYAAWYKNPQALDYWGIDTPAQYRAPAKVAYYRGAGSVDRRKKAYRTRPEAPEVMYVMQNDRVKLGPRRAPVKRARRPSAAAAAREVIMYDAPPGGVKRAREVIVDDDDVTLDERPFYGVI